MKRSFAHFASEEASSPAGNRELEQRLNELEIELLISATAGGGYAPVVVHRDSVYVSGQLARNGE
ncbi:hypothetical protein [Bradyrhizobium sp. USDA 4454]